MFYCVCHEEYLGAAALTDCARGDHTHGLASYFLVQSSTALHLLSGEQRNSVLAVLDNKDEDIYLVALSNPPQTLTPKNLALYLTSAAFTLYRFIELFANLEVHFYLISTP